jgi:hypothetical protein
LRRTVVLLISIAALPVGCGGGNGGRTDEEEIRSVAAAFNSAQLALFEGAPVSKRLCSLMTMEAQAGAATTLRRAHKRGGCPRVFRLFQRSVVRAEMGPQRARTRIKFLKRRMRHYRINSIRIRGDTAIVTANTSVIHGEGGPTVVKKEGGKWLIAGEREH